jgi:hypothetical protein
MIVDLSIVEVVPKPDSLMIIITAIIQLNSLYIKISQNLTVIMHI